MNDRQIRAGDLVFVTKPMPCCGYAAAVGKVTTVQKKIPDGKPFVCESCNKKFTTDGGMWWMLADDRARHQQRLKRIPPLEELDAVERSIHSKET